MNNYELQEKAARAAVRFLERKGYEILDVDWVSREGTKVDLVANDGDCLVFIDLNVKEYGDGPLEGGKIPRSDFEVAAAGWLADSSHKTDIRVRFDTVDMLVVNGGKALLRHHINALGCGIE